MIFTIENFKGDDIVKLHYPQILTESYLKGEVINVAEESGFSHADDDEDDEGNIYTRLQMVEETFDVTEKVAELVKKISLMLA